MKKQICEFEVSDLLPLGLTIVVAGIGIVYGLNVLSDVKTDMATDCPTNILYNGTADDTAYNTTAGYCQVAPGVPYYSDHFNASTDSISGTAIIPIKLPLIATVVVAAIVIGILFRYLMVRFA